MFMNDSFDVGTSELPMMRSDDESHEVHDYINVLSWCIIILAFEKL